MAIALIDADSIYYKAAFRKDKKDIRQLIDKVMLQIEGQCFATPEDCKVAVKGRGNFRKDLYPKYKANRKVDEDLKPYLNYGHQYMVDKYEAVMADGMEADDLVSIWAYEAREMELQYVVVGIDKDLKQIPGNHYNFNKVEHSFIDDAEAHRLLMIQCLTGDTSDNIPGLRGIGPKKAEKILEGVPTGEMWSKVVKAWGNESPWLSRKLLTMLTSWEEFDEVKKECEQKKTEGLIRGKSTSESTASPSPSTKPTSESEEEM